MIDSTFQDVTQPDAGLTDPLHELLRKGARDLIVKAVEAELTTFLEQFADKTLEDGRRAVVHNGYLPDVVVKYFWPLNFEHSSSSFLPHSAAVHRYSCAA